jgi:hypothetical protein
MIKAYTIQVTQAHSGTFKVSMSDHNGNSNTVYEMSVENALNYAKVWCNEAEERQHSKEILNKAIMESIALDRIAGITTSTSDSLD